MYHQHAEGGKGGLQSLHVYNEKSAFTRSFPLLLATQPPHRTC